MTMEKGKGYWKLKKNVGNHAFSEIIKHPKSKKKYKECVVIFSNFSLDNLWRMRGYPNFLYGFL